MTGAHGDEPLSTLAKTRKVNGKTYFGRHVCLAPGEVNERDGEKSGRTVMVGDRVVPVYEHE